MIEGINQGNETLKRKVNGLEKNVALRNGCQNGLTKGTIWQNGQLANNLVSTCALAKEYFGLLTVIIRIMTCIYYLQEVKFVLPERVRFKGVGKIPSQRNSRTLFTGIIHPK